MPAAIAIPAIATAVSGGVGAVASIYGAHKQSESNDAAAQLQYKYNEDALAAAKEEQQYQRQHTADVTGYNRQQQANYQSRMQPYTDAGAAAASRVGAILGNTQNPYAAASAQSTPQGGDTLTFRAPGGTTFVRPAVEKDHWLAKGAQVL